jgi:hypothetical protein
MGYKKWGKEISFAASGSTPSSRRTTPRRVEQYFGLSHLHDGFELVEPVARRERSERGHEDDKEHLGCDV